MEFEEVAFSDAVVNDEVKKKKSHPIMPRAWQWSKVKQTLNQTLVNVIDREEEFNFRPYIHTPLVLFRSHSIGNTTKTSLCHVRIIRSLLPS